MDVIRDAGEKCSIMVSHREHFSWAPEDGFWPRPHRNFASRGAHDRRPVACLCLRAFYSLIIVLIMKACMEYLIGGYGASLLDARSARGRRRSRTPRVRRAAAARWSRSRRCARRRFGAASGSHRSRPGRKVTSEASHTIYHTAHHKYDKTV